MNINKKLTTLYLSMCLLALLILSVMYQPRSPSNAVAPEPVTNRLYDTFVAKLDNPLSHLLIQLLIIISVSRMFGVLFKKLKQPTVVGEMLAGILLGPSLLGLFAPAAFAYIFPASTLDTLRMLSQLGVCLFMFCVGMSLDLNQLRSKARSALIVSQVGIVVPFLFGVGLAFFIFARLAGPEATFLPFALFMGIAMSITAFPVLARILQDNNMASSPIGLMALSCAAVDDITAWCILAFIVAIAQATGVASSFLNLGLVIIYIGFMSVVGRKLLARYFLKLSSSEETTDMSTLSAIILIVIASALWTEAIGIHALFGAFMAGVILPKGEKFRKIINFQIENLSTVLLVPIFFVFTGLRTEVGLLGEPVDWALCLGIIFLATIGKFGGCTLAARVSGMAWTESLQLGALMNTRGLMELIVLNIGLDLGIFSQRLFTMFVLMALVTTIFTGPSLNFVRRKHSTHLTSDNSTKIKALI